jgi:hypothetical protein
LRTGAARISIVIAQRRNSSHAQVANGEVFGAGDMSALHGRERPALPQPGVGNSGERRFPV